MDAHSPRYIDVLTCRLCMYVASSTVSKNMCQRKFDIKDFTNTHDFVYHSTGYFRHEGTMILCLLRLQVYMQLGRHHHI